MYHRLASKPEAYSQTEHIISESFPLHAELLVNLVHVYDVRGDTSTLLHVQLL